MYIFRFLLLAAISAGISAYIPQRQTFYYFCQSNSFNPRDLTVKNFVLYTDIRKIECDEQQLKGFAQDWKLRVDSICKNKRGCTSDLMAYPTLEAAKLQYEKLKSNFVDTSIWVVKKVSFDGPGNVVFSQ